MTDWTNQPVRLKISGYEHLTEADRKKIDKMLDDMKKQRDSGQTVSLPDLRSKK